mgnify:CR=1 FL=1
MRHTLSPLFFRFESDDSLHHSQLGCIIRSSRTSTFTNHFVHFSKSFDDGICFVCITLSKIAKRGIALSKLRLVANGFEAGKFCIVQSISIVKFAGGAPTTLPSNTPIVWLAGSGGMKSEQLRFIACTPPAAPNNRTNSNNRKKL